MGLGGIGEGGSAVSDSVIRVTNISSFCLCETQTLDLIPSILTLDSVSLPWHHSFRIQALVFNVISIVTNEKFYKRDLYRVSEYSVQILVNWYYHPV
jgi:hypothetical protein